MNILDKTAIITGAAGGIGRGIAISLAKRGCHLALVDVDAQGLEETLSLVNGSGVRVSTHVTDLAHRPSIEHLRVQFMDNHKGLDMLVNNAGIAAGGDFMDVREDVFDRVMEINFHAVVRMTRTFLPLLKNSTEARIVNISSVFGIIAPAGQTAYAASKFAVRGFSNALRHELRGTNVGVTVVHPGGVATSIARNSIPSDKFSEAEVRKRVAVMEKHLKMDPGKAGEIIVSGVAKNRSRIIVGSDARFLTLMERLFPVSYWGLINRRSGSRPRR